MVDHLGEWDSWLQDVARNYESFVYNCRVATIELRNEGARQLELLL